MLGFQQIISEPIIFVLLVLGVFMGIVFGSIPGLTGALAISLVLPFTYHMTANNGLSLLIAIYVGSISGGLISAILLNIPGTPSSIVTCFDGAPMAKEGHPSKALVLGTFASLIGGLIGGLVLVLISGPMATFSLKFGYWEYFAMGIMGLCIVISLTGDDPLKGYISAILGILAGMVGTDSVSTVTRFTFGQWQLQGGFSSLPVLMGLFAISEIVASTRNINAKVERRKIDATPMLPKKEWLKGTGKTTIVSSLIGTIIGILPGIGQATASLLAYTTAKQSSKHPEKFGTGIIDGIAASEASNNAATGGAMVPLLSLGIPGGNAAAVMMSALTLKGVQLGPLLLTNQPTYLSATFMSMIVTNILMVIVAMAIAKVFAQILAIPYSYLGPIILMLALIGTYGDQMSATSVQIMVLAGVLGLVVRACHLNSAAIVLGLVLGNMCEQNFSRGYLMARANVFQMFNPTLHPIAFVLIIVCIALLVSPVFMSMKKKKAAS